MEAACSRRAARRVLQVSGLFRNQMQTAVFVTVLAGFLEAQVLADVEQVKMRLGPTPPQCHGRLSNRPLYDGFGTRATHSQSRH
ncbi:hypothetical protein FVE85_9457 [Porphyridium purpureum]|uniref:Uncharacterized protein n=1 Tax=Porphyridium purpureum TaxID=35688 RepID=A0A5J4YJC9_PORPP|nr:hypothetical protein FVE85_9457 [Porphyridium purpureum]|eukprot:POR4092..scf261_15